MLLCYAPSLLKKLDLYLFWFAFLFTSLIIIVTFEIATYLVQYEKYGHEKSIMLKNLTPHCSI